MKTSLLLATVLSATFLLTGCGKKESAATGPALTKVKLQTDWYPHPEHGGYYQALAKGNYPAEGHDV